MRLLLLLSALLGALTGGMNAARVPAARSQVVQAVAVARPTARDSVATALHLARRPTRAANRVADQRWSVTAPPAYPAAPATDRLLV